ncbi:MAG: hypothetical protein ABF264_09740 [Flavobacteriales bacterium]
MELTEKHIEELYQFTRDHYVEWYDLQTELVDHLAANIEEIWKENPSNSFEKARDISFKKFGVFGFGDVVEEKTKALHKHYRISIFREFLQFFRLPKIILTLFFLIGTYYLFSFFNNGYFIPFTFILTLVVIPFYQFIGRLKKFKSRNRSSNKRWMIDNVLLGTGIVHYIFLTPFQVWSELIFKPDISQNSLIFISFSFVLAHLIHYVTTNIVRPNMQNKMAEMYPEYEII